MNKRRNLIVIITVIMLVLAACGQSNDKAPITDKTTDVTTVPTPTEVPIEAEIETLPMLDQLLTSDSSMQNLNKNYKAEVNLAFDMVYGNVPLSIRSSGENLSYEDVAYSDLSVKMEYAGAIEEQSEKQYRVYSTDEMITEYTFSPVENVWHKSEYYDATDDEDISLVRKIAEMDADDFSVIETTSDDKNIYITAIPDPKFAIDGTAMFSGFGVTDIGFSGMCEFVFDKETKEFVSMEFRFELDNPVTEDMKENGIASITIDEFSIVFMPNTTPVVVPDEVIADAVAK